MARLRLEEHSATLKPWLFNHLEPMSAVVPSASQATWELTLLPLPTQLRSRSQRPLRVHPSSTQARLSRRGSQAALHQSARGLSRRW